MLTGKAVALDVDAPGAIDHVRVKTQDQEGFHPGQQRPIPTGTQLVNGDSFQEDSALLFVLFPRGGMLRSAEILTGKTGTLDDEAADALPRIVIRLRRGMQISVNMLTGKTVTLDIEASAVFDHVENATQGQDWSQSDQQRLISTGMHMQLGNDNFQEGPTLHLVLHPPRRH